MVAPLLSHSRRTRMTPYHDATVAAGVTAFTVYNHMLLPTVYESADADYWHIVNGVSMWDVAVQRQIELQGPDAHRLLTLMTPRDMSTFEIGQGKYAPLCDERGRIVNDPVILKIAEDTFWISIADSDVRLWAMGLAYGLGLDVTIDEPDVAPMAIQGPRSDDVAADLFGDWVRELRFFRFREADLDGIPMLVSRSGWSKQGGFELYLTDTDRAGELWERVADAGEPHGIRPGAPNLMERIEGGLLSYGNDMTLDHTPLEVGLERYCHLDQPADFLAKEALQEQRDRGVDRHQVGLVIHGDRLGPSSRWYDVLGDDEEPIGVVTSAAWSPRLQRNLAFAIVDMEHQEPGTEVTIQMFKGRRRATVTPMPFIR